MYLIMFHHIISELLIYFCYFLSISFVILCSLLCVCFPCQVFVTGLLLFFFISGRILVHLINLPLNTDTVKVIQTAS